MRKWGNLSVAWEGEFNSPLHQMGKIIRFINMDNESDIIITRNKKDFKNSKIPVMTAGEYIRR